MEGISSRHPHQHAAVLQLLLKVDGWQTWLPACIFWVHTADVSFSHAQQSEKKKKSFTAREWNDLSWHMKLKEMTSEPTLHGSSLSCTGMLHLQNCQQQLCQISSRDISRQKKKCTGGAASVTGKGKNPDNKDENPEVHLIYCLFQVEYLSGNWHCNMLHFK